MKKISTIFDYNHDHPIPQISAIYDDITKKIEFLPIYTKGRNTSVKSAKNNINKIAETIINGTTIINDALSHILFINSDEEIITPGACDIYDNRLYLHVNDQPLKSRLVRSLINTPVENEWMKTKAEAAIVYAYLTKYGITWGPHHEFPLYDTRTITGRSRTKGFNIQGTTNRDPIKHIDIERSCFICFDWVSADIKMVGYLSNDKFINDSFLTSDPYSEIEKLLDTKDITRNDCKIEFFKNIYSADLNGPLLDLMPNMKSWMKHRIADYDAGCDLKTISGMSIPKKDIKTSFSGMIQGSIAEAIQNVIIEVSKIDISCILTEIHDSLVVAVQDNDVAKTIDNMLPFMVKPFKNKEIRFSVRVSIGRQWKQWKTYKVFK